MWQQILFISSILAAIVTVVQTLLRVNAEIIKKTWFANYLDIAILYASVFLGIYIILEAFDRWKFRKEKSRIEKNEDIEISLHSAFGAIIIQADIPITEANIHLFVVKDHVFRSDSQIRSKKLSYNKKQSKNHIYKKGEGVVGDCWETKEYVQKIVDDEVILAAPILNKRNCNYIGCVSFDAPVKYSSKLIDVKAIELSMLTPAFELTNKIEFAILP